MERNVKEAARWHCMSF